MTFTRDFDAIKAALNKVEVFSKTCIETALNGVRAVIADEWNNTSNQVRFHLLSPHHPSGRFVMLSPASLPNCIYVLSCVDFLNVSARGLDLDLLIYKYID